MNPMRLAWLRLVRGGAFTLQGSRVASPTGGAVPEMVVDAAARRFGLLTTQFDDRVEVQGAVVGL